MDEIELWVRHDLAGTIGVDAASITHDLPLTDLGLSSSQLMELVYRAEEAFDTVLNEETIRRAQSVGDLANAIAVTAAPRPVA